jgi:tetratricopeptide (TPR) repeat protein
MFQMWNNCGPANLAMALSYWGWKGDQRLPAAYLKPNQRDKNVMPYEMESYVEQQAGMGAVVRVGGDLQTLKSFIAAGFPVLVEKGFEGEGFDGWMGHYQVVSGYDDAAGQFIVQDSYKGPDLPIPYDQFVSDWRAFNYTYLVVYPAERRQQVLATLGLQAYDTYNNRAALQKADADVAQLTGRDLYFSLFNQGANLVAEKDYTRAAAAYDAAFANYAQIPEATRPWRMMWYQTGPYFAYYYSGRYQDVIDLANVTFDTIGDDVLEESWHWRGMGRLALGDNEGAIADFREAVRLHPGFAASLYQLELLGVAP